MNPHRITVTIEIDLADMPENPALLLSAYLSQRVLNQIKDGYTSWSCGPHRTKDRFGSNRWHLSLSPLDTFTPLGPRP
jgi:hypothetical protein